MSTLIFRGILPAKPLRSSGLLCSKCESVDAIADDYSPRAHSLKNDEFKETLLDLPYWVGLTNFNVAQGIQYFAIKPQLEGIHRRILAEGFFYNFKELSLFLRSKT
jgi:hypothetical protein